MGRIEDLRLFVYVVENGSISKAAASLNIAKSAVSRRRSLLEERYETRLVDRSPGTWEVTATGRELYQRAIQIVGDIDEIDEDFVNVAANITGPLSVSVPRDFGISFLKAPLLAFKQRHPEIRLTVDFDNRAVDLAAENYDVAIRITAEPQREMSSLQIGTVRHRLFSSSGYLEDHPEPQSLDDLRRHNLLHYGTARRAVWVFTTETGRPQRFEFQPFLNSNSGMFLLEATRTGLGIARLPDFIAAQQLKTGGLIPVLPGTGMPEWRIYLVFAEQRRLNRRMRLFAEAMKSACMPGRCA